MQRHHNPQKVPPMKHLLPLLSLGAALLLAPVAQAADQATPADAKAMATKAADYLKSAGPDKAFAAFDAKDNSTWHDRDLYVTVEDDKGVLVAHGTNPGLIGRPMLNLRDVDGKPFNQEIQAIKDAGWVSYKWQNPVTKAVEAKTAYEVRVGEYIVGVGAYAK
jgi:signal transduction histidine kinase